MTGPGAANKSNNRRTITVAVLAIGLLALVCSLAGVVIEVLPRHFTAAQQQAIMTWEESGRWRELPAGQVFASQVTYAPPAVLDDIGSSVTLTAHRVGIARQASCAAATDKAAGAVLTRGGCEAVLRATYADDANTYVVTVGVGTFASGAQATAARQELGSARLRTGPGRPPGPPGVRTVPFAGTPAAAFTNSRRQISGNVAEGPYLVMYTIGYADGRPLLPISGDNYQQAEMTSLGTGVARAVATVLGAPPPAPQCPGAPGC